MSIKDIIQTIDAIEISQENKENARLSKISASILEKLEGENLSTALSVLINSLEYLIKQLPEQDQNDARMKMVEFIDPKSYTKQKS